MTTLIAPPVDRRMTADEFDVYVSLPENADRRLEWHDGESFEMVAAFESSNPSIALLAALANYLRQNRIGVLASSEAGFIVNGARYMTDGAFIRTERKIASTTIKGYTSVAPDLAIESISPTDKTRSILKKLKNYEAAGTVVWLVDYDTYTIDVHVPGATIQSLTIDDSLDGGALLPGFSVPVKEVFDALIMLAEASKASGE
ncbi:MAG: Uma2 family endonuclease [Chloroflexota bacterium]|nr:Uma2 family endonuclease [Chloroflexota bacterium]